MSIGELVARFPALCPHCGHRAVDHADGGSPCRIEGCTCRVQLVVVVPAPTAWEAERREIGLAYLEHLGAAASYAWRLQHDSWDQGASSYGPPMGFWLHQPRALRRLADMPPWTPLCSPPLETRDGPDPRVSCKACRGHGYDSGWTTPAAYSFACAVCRGRGVVVP